MPCPQKLLDRQERYLQVEAQADGDERSGGSDQLSAECPLSLSYGGATTDTVGERQ